MEKKGTECDTDCIFTPTVAPLPFPPVIVTTGVSSYAKPGSISLTSFRDPLTATQPVAPVPTASAILAIGGFITSYPLPPPRTSIPVISP